MLITSKHLYSAGVSESEAKSNTDNSNSNLVLVSSLVDANSDPVIVDLKIKGKGKIENSQVDASIILSTYGKEKFNNYIKRAIEENRVLFYDKEKSQVLQAVPGVQFPNNIASLDLNHNVSLYKKIVNKDNLTLFLYNKTIVNKRIS